MITMRKVTDDIFMVGILGVGEVSFHSIESARQAYDLLSGQEKVRGKASLDSILGIESVK